MVKKIKKPKGEVGTLRDFDHRAAEQVVSGSSIMMSQLIWAVF
jgi:hypothetical protein